MHTRLLGLAAAASLTLAACNSAVGNVNAPDVSGALTGFPNTQGVNLALVGFGAGGVTNNSTQAAVIDPRVFDAYAFDLPQNGPSGTYKLIAYRDANTNGSFDLGETVTAQNDMNLVYDAQNGWRIQNADGSYKTRPLNNYNLAYNDQ